MFRNQKKTLVVLVEQETMLSAEEIGVAGALVNLFIGLLTGIPIGAQHDP